MSHELATALVALKVDDETQQRYYFLADGRREGGLSKEESAELEDLIQVNSVLSFIRMQARVLLAQASDGLEGFTEDLKTVECLSKKLDDRS